VDPETQQPRIKLYRDDQVGSGQCRGDDLVCTVWRVLESVGCHHPLERHPGAAAPPPPPQRQQRPHAMSITRFSPSPSLSPSHTHTYPPNRPQGELKGDASIAYVRPESVELAIEILNGGLLRPNCPVTISKGACDAHSKANMQHTPRRKEPSGLVSSTTSQPPPQPTTHNSRLPAEGRGRGRGGQAAESGRVQDQGRASRRQAGTEALESTAAAVAPACFPLPFPFPFLRITTPD
jgi:hypothetical protein